MTLAGTGATIEIRNVVKRYADEVALDDVSLHVRAGEFITLLGSSGSGKSTLLNIVAGFIDPTGGSVAVDGHDLTRVPPHKRDLGMVFQHYALFPHLTVQDNVAFPLRRRRVPKPALAARVAEALAVVELGHLARRRPSELSGGQQQRVALARAIVFRPRVLLMDEPLGALDKRLRQQLQLEMKRLHSELGTTFVFVTHDQEEALAMSDRIALLRDGRIVQVGTPEELYERPSCRYTAEFLGESNIFRGRYDGAAFVDGATGARFFAPQDGKGAAALVVRPEHLGVRPPGEPAPSGHNVLDGVIRDVVYLGSDRRVEITLRDGRHLVARAPARDARVPEPGQPAVVHWHAEAGVIVADDPASPVPLDPAPVSA
jgi:putative spermidine/putrescine transport system ATP-binding protein